MVESLPTPTVCADFCEVLGKLCSISRVQRNLCWLIITHRKVTLAIITLFMFTKQRLAIFPNLTISVHPHVSCGVCGHSGGVDAEHVLANNSPTMIHNLK